MIRVASIFYAVVALVAIGLNALRGERLFPLAGNEHLGVALAAAVGLALATVAFSALAARAFRWARALEAAFRRALGPAGWREVLLLAASSSVAEELFFRGALQPALQHALGSDAAGLVAATGAFALLHVLPQKGGVLWAWTVFAFVLGLVLGGLFWWSGSLAPPIVLHALVNAINLRRITRPRRPKPRAADPLTAPRPVATPRRAP